MYTYSWAIALGLFLGTLAAFEIGRRAGRWRVTHDREGAPVGTGTIDAAVFALLGLLVAFTFGSAAARFEARRDLIVQEANAIGTAYLRLDTLPAAAQPALKDKLRAYVDRRLETYRLLPDLGAAQESLKLCGVLQGEIWSMANAAVRDGGGQSGILVLPALNAMFDITTTRTYAARAHPPVAIFMVLIGLAWVCAALAGYGTAAHRRPSLLHQLSFAAVMAVTIYLILDLEYPRFGLIRVSDFDQALIDVRAMMVPPEVAK